MHKDWDKNCISLRKRKDMKCKKDMWSFYKQPKKDMTLTCTALCLYNIQSENLVKKKKKKTCYELQFTGEIIFLLVIFSLTIGLDIYFSFALKFLLLFAQLQPPPPPPYFRTFVTREKQKQNCENDQFLRIFCCWINNNWSAQMIVMYDAY